MTSNATPLHVLHIIPPNLRHRFSGAMIRWRTYFRLWNDPLVVHYVLDPFQNQMIEANQVFDFKYEGDQEIPSRRQRFFWIFKLLKSLKTQKGKYDILHFHVLLWGGLLSILWSRLHKIPALYESVLLDADTPGAIRKQSLGSLKVWLLKQIRGIVAISEPIAEEYFGNGFNNSQVFTLMNSVDTDLFHPVPSLKEQNELRQMLDLPEEAKILIFTGSLIQRKGVAVLLEGFLEALQKHPDLFLLLVGPKDRQENPSLDEAYVASLSEMIVKHNAEARVRMTGLISNRETLAELYRASDMFIFPSRREGLPNVVLEAMASGLPVIVSDLPVLRSVIREGENGLTVPIEDAGAVSDAICRVYENPGMAKVLGRKARKTILERHTFERWQRDLVEIYQEIHGAI